MYATSQQNGNSGGNIKRYEPMNIENIKIERIKNISKQKEHDIFDPDFDQTTYAWNMGK